LIEKKQLIVLYFICMLYLSCEQPQSITVEDAREQEIEESTEENDVQEDAEEIIKKPETPAEETIKMINFVPIDDYQAYAFADGRLKGLSGDKAETCKLIDNDDNQYPIHDFYHSGGVLYFCVEIMETGDSQSETVKHYYKQTDGIIETMQESEFTPPKSYRITMVDTFFKIQDGEYNGQTISHVYQGSAYRAYVTIDGFLLNDSGLWFSVPEGVKHAEAGIWFCKDQTSRCYRVTEYGRIF
jgi:hypothetical protein